MRYRDLQVFFGVFFKGEGYCWNCSRERGRIMIVNLPGFYDIAKSCALCCVDFNLQKVFRIIKITLMALVHIEIGVV